MHAEGNDDGDLCSGPWFLSRWLDLAACCKALRAAGHEVHTPSLDGCAERRQQVRPGIDATSQGEEIADLLFFEDLYDVVLVGTSSGGMVTCRAAELTRDRIARLVFVDALALFNGERIRDIVTRSSSVASGLTAGPSREDAEQRLFADLEPATRAWVLDRYTPHPVGVSETPVKLDNFSEPAMADDGDRCRRAPNPAKPINDVPPSGSTASGWNWTPAITRCSACRTN